MIRYRKTHVSKSRKKAAKSFSTSHSKFSLSMLKLQYKFWILVGVLSLAGIAMILRLETPVVWTFLYGIGGWARLTTPMPK